MRSFRRGRFTHPSSKTTTELPAPQDRHVIIDIRACGLRHSDVHVHGGHVDLGDGAKVSATRIFNPPRNLGHKIGGTVPTI